MQDDGVRRLGRVAVVVAALALIVLMWFGVRTPSWLPYGSRGARAGGNCRQGLCVREHLRRELLSIDQTLRILEYEWQRDPRTSTWPHGPGRRSRSVMFAPTLLADAQGIVRSSTRAAIIGVDISRRDYFRHEAALTSDDGTMFVGAFTQRPITRAWQSIWSVAWTITMAGLPA